MTIAELLKAQGANDDFINGVLEAMSANKIYTSAEENVDVRFGKLKTQHESTEKQLSEANALIEELKKSNKGNDGLQQRITDYEAQVTQLQTELAAAKLDAEIKVGLLAAKAVDVDYLTFKLKEKGEIALDENGKIKGWDDKLAGLQTQHPTMFETAANKNILENKLPPHNENAPAISKEQFNKMGYGSRVELKQNNPELYSQLMKG